MQSIIAKSHYQTVRVAVFIIFILAIMYFTLSQYFKSNQPGSINIISESLQYGNTALVGTIRKDAPLGSSGNYYLVLNSGVVIALNSQGIDNYVGLSVKVVGYLSPKVTSTYPSMQVDAISLAQ